MNLDYILDLYILINNFKLHLIKCQITYGINSNFPVAQCVASYEYKDYIEQIIKDQALCQLWIEYVYNGNKKKLLLEGYINFYSKYFTQKSVNLSFSLIHKYVKYSWYPLFTPNVFPGTFMYGDLSNYNILEYEPTDVLTPTLVFKYLFKTLESDLLYKDINNYINKWIEHYKGEKITIDIDINQIKNLQSLFNIPNIDYLSDLKTFRDHIWIFYLNIISNILNQLGSMTLFNIINLLLNIMDLSLIYTANSAIVTINKPFFMDKNAYIPELNIDTISITITNKPRVNAVCIMGENVKENTRTPIPLVYIQNPKIINGKLFIKYPPEFLQNLCHTLDNKKNMIPIFTLHAYDEYVKSKYLKKTDINYAEIIKLLENEAKYIYNIENLNRYEINSIICPFTDDFILPCSYVKLKDLVSIVYGMINSLTIFISKPDNIAQLQYNIIGAIPEEEFNNVSELYYKIPRHPWYKCSEEKNYYLL